MRVPATWKLPRLLLWAVGSWCFMAVVTTLVAFTRGEDLTLALPVLTVVFLAEGVFLGILVLRMLRLRRVLGSERLILEEFRRQSPEATPLVRQLEKLNDEASHLATV